MKRIALMLLAVAFLASVSIAKDKASGAKSEKMSGWVTDAKCAAKDVNSAASAKGADCAKKCAEGGEKLVFVSDKNKTIYQVDNQDAVKDHAGHHVKVTGSVNNDTLHVDKVDMLSQGTDKSKGKSSGM